MITPEKNDVDVSELFNWGKEYQLALPNGNIITLYVRVVSDEEFNKARVYALRKAKELRDRILNKKTDEYKAYISIPSNMKKSDLIGLIITLEYSKLYSIAEKEVDLPFPKMPEADAPTSEWVKYQEEIDSYPTRFSSLVGKRLSEILKQREIELGKLTKEQLKVYYTKQVLEMVLNRTVEEEFIKACTFYGTYKDKNYTKRFFNSIEDIDRLPPQIKEQVIEAYMEVDIPMDKLKKLPGAML